MSSKEEFIRKAQESEKNRVLGEEKQKNDILAFQNRIHELSKDIAQWVSGTPVKITVDTFVLHDGTTVNVPGYKVDNIILSYNGKSIRFEPEALYYMGQTGGMNIKFSGVTNPPQVSLLMRSDFAPNVDPECWVFVRNGSKATREEFTEDNFFELLKRIL
ncbi:hypothetical protein ACX1HO_03260 [Yersinia enterocolitica]|uniref:hypothetical protein n=1 Tax=Yersinia enterocolitica TaxID=630 RepID=UPI003D093806